MRIEVICTGDEVLTGKIVNTNFSYISQKLEDVGLSVHWETTVGDDRESLLLAFQLAGERADAVIVNGGLGPTVDDLSQEIAAQAAGVELVLSEEWLDADGGLLHAPQPRHAAQQPRSRRCCPPRREVIDNPIGTACGFARRHRQGALLLHARACRASCGACSRSRSSRGSSRRAALQTAIYLKRFHSYGIGESHADTLLAGRGGRSRPTAA